MNKITWLIVVVLAFAAGAMTSFYLAPTGGDNPSLLATAKKPLYWYAPMDPDFRRDSPGKSPMGMDLMPFYASEDPRGTVRISPVVENNLGVELAKAQVQDLDLLINTVGLIQYNEEDIYHVHTRTHGWIENLSVTAVGDHVKRGDKLFELYAPELVNAQEDFLSILKMGDERLLKGAKRNLMSMGVSAEVIVQLQKRREALQYLPFYASQSGYVGSLGARDGMHITADTEVLSIGSLSKVWVIAEVFERQAAWVKTGQKVRMKTDTWPGDEWLGTVDYLYPVLDKQTRTLRARIVFDNPDERLKPNMYAQLTIEAGARPSVVTIPRKAVIYQGGMQRVVLHLGQGRYRSVIVDTGLETGELIEVRSGLENGDEIVVSSQFLIDSESSVGAELSRMQSREMSTAEQDMHMDDQP
ncbi:MAG: efflux RND transporter periplasmic adaptor subunit [Pseudomonadales bacterium]